MCAGEISGMGLLLLEHDQKNRVRALVIWLTTLLRCAWSIQRYWPAGRAGMLQCWVLQEQGQHSSPRELTNHHGNPGFIPYWEHQEVISPSLTPSIIFLHPAHTSKPACLQQRRGSLQLEMWTKYSCGPALAVLQWAPGNGLPQRTDAALCY